MIDEPMASGKGREHINEGAAAGATCKNLAARVAADRTAAFNKRFGALVGVKQLAGWPKNESRCLGIHLVPGQDRDAVLVKGTVNGQCMLQVGRDQPDKAAPVIFKARLIPRPNVSADKDEAVRIAK